MAQSIAFRLAFLLLIVLVISAFIAPPVSLFIQANFPQLNWPYSRIYDRVLLLVAVLVVYLMRRSFFGKGEGLNINFTSRIPYLRLVAGIAISLIPVLLILPWLADGRVFVTAAESDKLVFRVLKLLPTMFVVGIIEEIVFRYFLFLQFRKTMSFLAAASLSSIIYAIVHFVTPVKTFVISEYDWLSGFVYYQKVFAQLADFNLFIQLAIMFSIGFMLTLVLEKTKTITICIGLHAGWIAGIKLAKFTHDLKIELPAAAQRYALLESPLSWVAVAVSLLLILYIVKYVKFTNPEINSKEKENALVLLATSNQGKLTEMQIALNHPGIQFIGLKEAEQLLGCSAPEVEESGATYLENCLIKARAYHNWSKLPVISDDTGLEVVSLGNAPGIGSARYAGDTASADERNKKLIEELKGHSDRNARFVCELIFLLNENDYVNAQGQLKGSISAEMRGQGGFGYDSVFIVDETTQTLAEVKESNPMFRTHRKEALEKLNRTSLFQGFIKRN